MRDGNERLARVKQSPGAFGCGSCLLVLLYFGAIAGIIAFAVGRLVSRLSPDELAALESTAGESLDADTLDFLRGAGEPLLGVPLTVVAVVSLGGLLGILWRQRARWKRERREDTGEMTDWDRRRQALRHPALRVAYLCFVLALLVTYLLVAISLGMLVWPGAPVFASLTVFAVEVVLLGGALLLMVACVTAIVVATFSWGRPPAKEQLVYPELVRVFGSAVVYEPRGELVHNPLSTGLLPRGASVTCDDRVAGTWRGLEFEQADVRCTGVRRVRSAGGDGYEERPVLLFAGRWLVLRTARQVEGRVLVFSRTAFEAEEDRLKETVGLQPVEMEDATFGDYFRVFAESPHDAFYALTPQLMERLKALAGVESDAGTGTGTGADIALYAAFSADTLHVGVAGVKDAFFMLAATSASEADAREIVRSDIQIIVDVVDAMARTSNTEG